MATFCNSGTPEPYICHQLCAGMSLAGQTGQCRDSSESYIRKISHEDGQAVLLSGEDSIFFENKGARASKLLSTSVCGVPSSRISAYKRVEIFPTLHACISCKSRNLKA